MLKYELPLYKLRSKKALFRILKIPDKRFLNQEFIISKIHPHIEVKYINHKLSKRLIEAPDEDLKKIQKKINYYLSKNIFPENIFSGLKKRSYINNAYYHVGNLNIYKLDLTAFFPSITREKVFEFFCQSMKMSKDVSEIMTNLSTVDLDKTDCLNKKDINEFLISKNIKTHNHLISGAPTSIILSYLVNIDMFDELQSLADTNGFKMSIFVDDLTFSSCNKIPSKFVAKVQSIIKKYNYHLSKSKVKRYTKNYAKSVTGVIIDKDGKLTIPNKLRLKIIKEFRNLKEYPDDDQSRKRLKGLLSAARMISVNAYPQIYKFTYKKEP